MLKGDHSERHLQPLQAAQRGSVWGSGTPAATAAPVGGYVAQRPKFVQAENDAVRSYCY